MTKLILLTLSLLSVSSSAHAWGWHHHYWGEECANVAESQSTLVSQSIIKITGACESVALHLERTPWQDRTVDAWAGGYQRAVVMQNTYRIDHYDRCSGEFLTTETQVTDSDETLSFKIANPNLAEDQPSYTANAPLTPTEAKRELPQALKNCRSLHLR